MENQIPPPVEQIVPTAPPVSPENSNRNFWKTIGIGMSIVSFGIALAVGGYLLVVSKNKPAEVSISQITTAPTPDPTASWKTYTNALLGYSFRYPENIRVTIPQIEGNPLVKYAVASDMTLTLNGIPDENSKLYEKIGGIGGIGGVSIYKGFWLRVETTGIDSPADVIENVKTANSSSSTISIDGNNGYKRMLTSSGGGFEGTNIWIDIIKDKKVYSVTGSYPSNNPEYSKILEQILSTFKFTN